jgi:hypothetical protein
MNLEDDRLEYAGEPVGLEQFLLPNNDNIATNTPSAE